MQYYLLYEKENHGKEETYSIIKRDKVESLFDEISNPYYDDKKWFILIENEKGQLYTYYSKDIRGRSEIMFKVIICVTGLIILGLFAMIMFL